MSTVDDAELVCLPDPQRYALRVAMLREEPRGEPAGPDPRAVGVALSNLLRGLSADGPLLVAVDDAHWLDTGSAAALVFAARRLVGDPVRWLLGRRGSEEARLPPVLASWLTGGEVERLNIPPLDAADLRRLLLQRVGGTIPAATLRRIADASGGNPLFALEIARVVQESGADIDPMSDLPIPERIMALLSSQVGSLPKATRSVLAVAALLDRPMVAQLAEIVGAGVGRALARAVDAGIVRLDAGVVVFTHPLRAYAARSGLDAGRTRTMHARLAGVVTDPERRARHLALAADGPDELVAAALENAADRARSRGASEAAIELAGLAWRFTPDAESDAVIRRRAMEARLLIIGGTDPEHARVRAEQLLALSAPGPARAEALRIMGWLQLSGLQVSKATELFREAIAEVGPDSIIRMQAEAALTYALDVQGEDYAESIAHGRAELAIAEHLDDKAHIGSALRGLARNIQRTTGQIPSDLLERALTLEPAVASSLGRPVSSLPSVALAEVLSWNDDHEAAAFQWQRLLDIVGPDWQASSFIELAAHVPSSTPSPDAGMKALRSAKEACDLAVALGYPQRLAVVIAGRALIEAHLGDENAVRRDAAEAALLEGPTGTAWSERLIAWAVGGLRALAG